MSELDSYSIQRSPLWQDIEDIVENKDSKIRNTVKISCVIHNKDYDIGPVDYVSVVKLQVLRDYVLHVSDYTEITIKMLLGDYVKKVYPYLANTDITLSITVKEGDIESKPNIQRYKAVYLIDKNNIVPNNLPSNVTDNNQLGFVNLTFQLIDRSVEVLRTKTIHGSFDNIITKDKKKIIPIDTFIKTVISHHSKLILIDGKPSLDGINIDKIDNLEPIRKLLIPSGTRVLDIPIYFQKKSMGIYNSGCGAYVQTYDSKKTYFVYSLYNTIKYKKSKIKCIIYLPLTSGYSHTKNTYKNKDEVIKIIGSTSYNLNDQRDSGLMSRGSGFRISNAKAYMTKPVEITEKGPVFKRTRLVTEIVNKERKDNLDYAKINQERSITYNIFEETTKVIERDGFYIDVKWVNSNPDILYPGMSCQIKTENDIGKIIELNATILKVDTVYTSMDYTAGSASMLNNKEFDTTTVLKLFLNPHDYFDKT